VKNVVLIGHADEGIDVLLEREIDPDADRTAAPAAGRRPFVRGLHQARTTAGDDVATELGQAGRHPLGLLVRERSRLHAGRPEDGHPIALAPRRAQASEIVYHIPQSEDGRDDDLLDGILIVETDEL
jgi:hypothetical protein